MTSQSSADRLVDEFNDGATWDGGFSVRHGIAAVLRHLVEVEAVYGDEESFYGIRASTLEAFAEALNAPSLLEQRHPTPVPVIIPKPQFPSPRIIQERYGLAAAVSTTGDQ